MRVLQERQDGLERSAFRTRGVSSSVNRIVPASRERVTVKDSAQAHERSAQDTVLFDGVDEITRACRNELALPTQQLGQRHLVYAHQQDHGAAREFGDEP